MRWGTVALQAIPGHPAASLRVLHPETYTERVAGYRDSRAQSADGLIFDLAMDSAKLVTMAGVSQDLRLTFIDNAGRVLATRVVAAGSGVYSGPPAARWLLETPTTVAWWLDAGTWVWVTLN